MKNLTATGVAFIIVGAIATGVALMLLSCGSGGELNEDFRKFCNNPQVNISVSNGDCACMYEMTERLYIEMGGRNFEASVGLLALADFNRHRTLWGVDQQMETALVIAAISCG